MSKANKVSGIYKIKNKINGKIYIGLSVDIYDRWGEHTRKLNKNQHDNKYLQRAWNKYGGKNFEFSIIELCDKELLCEKEIFNIKTYDTYRNGYNLTKGGEGTVGRIHSEETKRKISKANKGKGGQNSEQLKNINHTNIREIAQLNLKGELVNVWDSLLDVCNYFDKDIRRAIKGCCDRKAKRLTSLGFIWMWKDEYDEGNINISEYSNNNIKNRNRFILCKEIGMKFKDLDEIVVYFKEKMNIDLNKRCICNVISKKNRRYKNYTFSYM